MDRTLEDPLVGRLVDDRYRVESRVAVGGMATVYRAMDTRLDRVVALKVMHRSLVQDRAFVRRFIREAKSVARLSHPHVVGVFDQGQDEDLVYLAMEYVPGGTLRDTLHQHTRLTPQAALRVLDPILAALSAAHQAGLVHRDMKPENVLIGHGDETPLPARTGSTDVIKVADFGLVRAVDTHTSSASSDTIMGTVSYLAPEQIQDGTAAPSADVYACGVMLFEMLTGTKPHNGETPAQVLYQHLQEDVRPPSTLVPGIPEEVDALVRAATDRDPERRPQDAGAFLAELRRVSAWLGATAPAGPEATSVIPRPTGAAHGTPPPSGTGSRLTLPGFLSGDGDWYRRPWALVTAGVLALLLVAGSVWYLTAGRYTDTPAVLAKSEKAATRAVEDAGLKPRVKREYSESVERGKVISSDPRPGARVTEGDTVTLSVSRGPRIAEVPDIRGAKLASAKRQLRKAGLVPGVVRKAFNEEVPLGAVVRTDPKPGAERRPGTAVALTVSQGRPVPVPSVLGQEEQEAREALEDQGLRVRIAEERVFSEREKGAVARQSPGAGSDAARGQTVTLTLSKGPDMVTVPDVEGRQRDDAVAELQAAGFTVNVNRIFFGNKVFNQSPDGGGTAPRGSEVTVWLR
ncbi:Stk1 family PASTA domain-containing Ser/Thr kinase [Streptomyces sp. NPDC005438]|uniref:Stk1 family PASTA domain-containing Ser/Thr kinase n=1 Tax=Streptomyces sp. NPDC005438 TaxID=3156880 RepID=UPI0033A07B2E